MSFGECPVIAPISAIEQPARARRVTVVPRRSWNVRPLMPAFSQAFRQPVVKPWDVHDFPRVVQRIVGAARVSASSAR